jgi:molybdate transport system regulatory protein
VTGNVVRLRLVFGDDAMFGPGKADLLRLIGETGSISAAGRRMGMSYRRAWGLVEDLNAAFREPLVESARGGPGGGGAVLTQTGRDVLELYRRLESRLEREGREEIAAIRERLADMSGRK